MSLQSPLTGFNLRPEPLTAAAFILILIFIPTKVILGALRSLHLPPGPKGWPVIGNLFDFPTINQAETFYEMSAQYGDITHFKVLGQHIIVLNTLPAAQELLDKRSSIYSDRPPFIMSELAGFSEWDGVVMRYGPQWRAHRRLFHQSLLPSALVHYQPAQLRITHTFLRRLLEDPQAFLKHGEALFAATAIRIAYGVDVEPSEEQHYIRIVKALLAVGIRLGVPGAYLVETLPALRYLPSWFPGAGFQREAAEIRNWSYNDINMLFRLGKEQVGKKSVVCDELTRIAYFDGEATLESEQIIAGAGATIYTAGAETPEASLQAFFLAMALNPTVQGRAHAELDAVVGRKRLPTFEDQAELPYTNAIVRELLRWHPVAPMGVPHLVMQDDYYQGYWIPKNSIVLPNAWAYSRDCPDPDCFRPERYMQNGQFNPEGRLDPYAFVFGFGRRICPGRHLAESSLFITCASVLHAFTISPVGTLEAKFTTGLITSHPEPFQCNIMPRWVGAVELILSDVA